MATFCDDCLVLYGPGLIELSKKYPILDNPPSRSMPLTVAFDNRRRIINEIGLCPSCLNKALELTDMLAAKHRVVLNG